MLRYAIPEYRLPRKVLEREIEAILSLGIDLKTSTRVGRDVPWMQIADTCDMVCVAAGAQRSAAMGIPGEDLEGVQGALEFLRAVRSEHLSCRGERVAVVGGGDSAIDAARTAIRLGAEEVRILYRRLLEDMPAQKDEIEAALQEGVRIECLVSPTAYTGRNGKVREVLYQGLTLGAYDSSGRRSPVASSDGGGEMRADRVLTAIGQQAEWPFSGRNHGVALSSRGWISIASGTSTGTSNPKVFAAGDITTGPATVAGAIAAGFRAAEEIDRKIRLLNGEPFAPPASFRPDRVPMNAPEETPEMPRQTARQRPAPERIRSFTEVDLGYDGKQALLESGRCLRCDIKLETEAEAARPAETWSATK
jgi:NADH-quinone oxidoreductase subunit F